MRTANPDPAITRWMIRTKYLRILGTRLYSEFTVTLEPESVKLRVRVHGGDQGVAAEIFDDRPYEKYFAPSQGETVADVGANIGCFTIRAAKLVGEEGRVIAFEPEADNYRMLVANISLNNLLNVVARQVAIVDYQGTATLRIGNNWDKTSLYLGDSSSKGKEEVGVTTLDDTIGSESHIDIIKIDAEGSELGILAGASKTIRRDHPKIVGEAHPAFGISGEKVKQYLTKYGYNNLLVEPYGKRGEVDLFFAWD